jgi:hypothetical protein
MTEPRSLTVPGDGLLHPVFAGAVALLLVNDHLLKSAFPGLISGKLSDVAGLVFFPMLMVATWEVLAGVMRRWRGPRSLPLIVAIIATAFVFVAIKVSSEGSSLFAEVLGRMQWFGASLGSWAVGGPTPRLSSVPAVRDPTDMAALIALLAALVFGVRRVNRHALAVERPPS